jgi:alkylation response protein AidB-like acyl-CoA dehydrogenase
MTDPDPETLVARARALVPAIRDRAVATEAARRIPDETIGALRDAGLFRLMQPARYGGLERDFTALVDVVGELGRGCGSTAWVYSVGAFHSWNVALFPEAAQDDVWGADSHALASSSYLPAGSAEPVDGGVRITGTWPFASGCDNFEWIILGVRLGGAAEGPPDLRLCLVPKADFAIDDNWHVAGLAGTGSKNVVVSDAFVPDHRMISFEDARAATTPGAAYHDRALYRLPFFAVASTCLVSPALGIAQGAIDHFVADMRGRDVRGITGVVSKAAQHYPIQARVSEASGLVDAARLLILRDCADTLATVEAGTPVSLEQRTRNKRDQALAMRFVKDAMRLVIDAAGAKGLFDDQPIQRAWRDVAAAGAHITLNWDIVMPAHGRAMLGLDPGLIV